MRSFLIILLLILSCMPSYSIDTLWIGQAHASPIVALEYSPNGRYIYSAGADSLIKVWDALNGDSLKAYKMPYDISSIFISKNETYLAVGMLKDSTYPRKTSFPAYVIDLKTDSIVTQVLAEDYFDFGPYAFTRESHYGQQNHVAISEDDSLLITGTTFFLEYGRPLRSTEGKLDTWNIGTGEFEKNHALNNGIMNLGFSNDWNTFFILTYRYSWAHQAYVDYYNEWNNIYLIDPGLESTTNIYSNYSSGEDDAWPGGSGESYDRMLYYNKASISPGTSYVAASSKDNKIALFSVPDGGELKKWQAGYPRNEYSPTDIEVSMNNRYVLTISNTGYRLNRLNIWDIKTTSVIDSIDFAGKSTNKHIAMSSDSVHFALAGEDGKIRVFNSDILSTIDFDAITKLGINSKIIDFGKLLINNSKDTTAFIVKNDNTEAIDISGTFLIGPDSSQFQILNGGGPFTLNPGEQRELTLRFNPVERGPISCSIGFNFDGIFSPATAYLVGEGLIPGKISTQSSYDFGSVICDETISMGYNIYNIGDFPLNVLSEAIEPNDGHFILLSSIVGHSINPDGYRTLQIKFQPQTYGEVTAELIVTSNGGEVRATLTGTKEIVGTVFSPNLIDFIDVNRYKRRDTNITITNYGKIPVTWNGRYEQGKFSIFNFDPNPTPPYGGQSDAAVSFSWGRPGESFEETFTFTTDTCGNELTLTVKANVKGLSHVEQFKPGYFFLYQNIPNPALEKTSIEFDLFRSSDVTLSVYDVFGKEVTVLQNGHLEEGSYKYEFSTGSMALGTYFYVLSTPMGSITRKMEVLK